MHPDPLTNVIVVPEASTGKNDAGGSDPGKVCEKSAMWRVGCYLSQIREVNGRKSVRALAWSQDKFGVRRLCMLDALVESISTHCAAKGMPALRL